MSAGTKPGEGEEAEPPTNHTALYLPNSWDVPARALFQPFFLVSLLIHFKLGSHSALGCNCGFAGLSPFLPPSSLRPGRYPACDRYPGIPVAGTR